MSQAESLLNSLLQTTRTVSTSPINDTIVIDAEGRIINVPGTEILFGVEHDANIERKHFQCPRFVGDNVDLTTLGLRIVYRNANNETDAYIVEDVKADGDTITFSWLLGEKVLRTKGTVYFTICAVNVDAEGNETRHWNTTLASGTVLEGMEFDGLYPDEEEAARDVLQQLLNLFESKADDVIQSVADEGTRQKAYLEEKAFGAMVKQTTERDTLLTVEDTADFRIVDLGLDGKTEQYTTTGKNLLNEKMIEPISVTADGVKRYGWDLGVLPQGDYTLSAHGNYLDKSPISFKTITDGVYGEYDSLHENTKYKNITLDGTKGLIVYLYQGVTELYDNVTLQLEKGTIMTEYEEFTGGIPSPNKNYPQPINHAGVYNEETGKYEVDVKVCNKNLLPYPYAETTVTRNGVTFTDNGDGSVTAQGTAERQAHFRLNQSFNFDKSINAMGKDSGTNGEYAINADLYYNKTSKMLSINIQSGVTVDRIYYPQLEKGTVSTPYIKHESQTVTLTSSRPITKWDRLEKRNGEYGWVFKSNVVSVKGTETFNTAYLPTVVFPKVPKGVNRPQSETSPKYDIYCNYHSAIVWSNLTCTTVGFNISKNGIETFEEFQAFLIEKAAEGRPFTYWYETEAETFEPLLPEEQEALKALETYRGVTHIWNDQNTPNQITYVADPEIYIDRKLSEFESNYEPPVVDPSEPIEPVPVIDDEKLSAVLIKPTSEKDTFVTIQDSAEYDLIGLEMDGKTEQNTTSGNNLFDLSLVNTSRVSLNDTGFTMKNIWAQEIVNNENVQKILEPNTRYICTARVKVIDKPAGNLNKSINVLYLYDNINTDVNSADIIKINEKNELVNGQIVEYTGSFVTKDLSNVKLYAYCYYDADTKKSVGEFEITDLMVRKAGITDATFEPYTNGPSPNPQFPQEINHAGELADDGRYSVDVTVANKNLFDKDYASDPKNWTVCSTSYSVIPYYVGAGNSVTVSYDATLTTGLGFYAGINKKGDGTTNTVTWFYHSDSAPNINNKITVTATEDYVYLYVGTYGITKGLFQNTFNDILQIELNSTATPYTPRETQTVTLTSSRPITKWDRLEKRDGVYGWAYNSKKYMFDGTETWAISSQGGFYCDKLTEKSFRNDGYCNQLTVDTSGALTRNNMFWLGTGNTVFYALKVKFYDTSLNDSGLANWKAHLQENPLEVWSYVRTETFEPLLPEEQEALEALETYYGTTHVYTNQNTPVQVQYVADPETYIENKIAEIPGNPSAPSNPTPVWDETQFTESLADAGFITILTDENGNTLTDENGNTLIAKGPEANHNPDWNETDESSPSFIMNKPALAGAYTYYVISENWLYKASNPSEANDSNLIKNIKTFEQDYLSGPIMLHMKNMANDRTYFPCIAFAMSDTYYVNFTYPGASVNKWDLSYDRNTGELI